ncbi:unnamed protein product [Caenorhabditis brenneri]
MEVNTEQLKKLTHVIFAYVLLDRNETLKFESETAEKRLWEMIKKAREVNKDLKVMVSIGGWGDRYQSRRYYEFTTDEVMRRNLLHAIYALAKEFEIDGVDIFQILIDSNESQSYLEFVQALRKKFDQLRKETFITLSVSHFENIREDRYLWKDLLKEIEFMNVHTYDYFNTKWNSYVGPTSPIYGGNRENVDSTIKYITCETGSPQKLNLVVPFYGLYWTNVSLPYSDGNFVWATPERYRQNWHLYESDLEKQRVRFRHLNDLLKQWPGAEYHFHNESKSSYYWIQESETFLTIEDEKSLREKVEYQNQMNIGGIGIMSIEDDDDEITLLKAIAGDERQCLTDKDYEVKYDCNQKF